MTVALTLRLDEVAARVGGTLRGDGAVEVTRVASLASAEADCVSFLGNPRYRDAASETRAAAVLVPRGVELRGIATIEVDRPHSALADLLEAFHRTSPPPPGVSPDARVSSGARLGRGVRVEAFACVENGAKIGDRARIGAGAYVGADAEIGVDTVVYPRVVLYPRTLVGDRCILHAGSVLGADGFGYATESGRHRKVPQVARVVVGDDVEIGANSTIDRGALDDTVIGDGTKIDDLVMIAHGVRVGRGCILVGQSGVAGSTRLGDGVTIAGQSGAAGHLEIGDGVTVAAKTAVFSDVPGGAVVSGVPARPHAEWKRTQALERRLPELRTRVRELERRLTALERERASEE